MKKREPQRSLRSALIGIGLCLLGHAAGAAPPATKLVVQAMHSSAAAEAPAVVKAPPSRLDLALPSSYGRASAGEFSPPPRGAVSMDALKATLPNLGVSGMSTGTENRVMSRPEAMARNFKREGLPIAKLFQSENSLVHIGLSPKGKPGLWIVEKLH